MKKRSRQDAQLYKEPSSDLSDLDLSSDDEKPKKGRSAAQASKRAKKGSQSTNVAENAEETKGEEAAKIYGKC